MVNVVSTWAGPRLIAEVELTNPKALPTLNRVDHSRNITYESTYLLARVHHYPVGLIEIPFDGDSLDLAAQFDKLVSQIEVEIRELLQERYGIVGATDLRATLSTLAPPAAVKTSIPTGRDQPFVSIVIGTRNRADKLRLTLESLLKLDYDNFEILIVDNAPSDDQTQRLVTTEFCDPRIRYICEPYPRLSRARNRGISESRGEIIAITDDDVLVDTQWLNAIVDAFSESDSEYKVACVTGLILPARLDTPAQELLERYGGFGKGFKRQLYDKTKNRPHSLLYPYSSGMLGSGANMAFSREFLCENRGFDEALGAGTLARGGEDLAILFEVIVSGGRLVYEPSALLYHFHNAEYEKLRNQMYSYGVGLIAYIVKIIFDNPWRIFEVLLRLPAGVVRIFSQNSVKNMRKGDQYPRELTSLELRGMLHAPVLFIRSVIQTHRVLGSRYQDLC